MAKNKWIFILVGLFMFLLASGLVTAGGVSVEATMYVEPYSSWACEDWPRTWIDSTTYCEMNYNFFCALCVPTLESRFADQYRTRECYNPVTKETITDYDFRTIFEGCCGYCVDLPIIDD